MSNSKIRETLSDIIYCWWVFLFSFMIAFMLGFIYLIIIKILGKYIVWFMIFGLLMLILILSGICALYAHMYIDPEETFDMYETGVRWS